jgi:hypothetical protein
MMNYASWLVGNYPDIHINIVTKTASLAEEILTALITRFESDETYKKIFGNLKPRQSKKWTSREIIVLRDEISKNPTLKATGLMGPITGGRSDLIICDDIIDEENIRTRLQLEKVSTWFNKVLYPTLYPWGGIIVIGTRWSYADIYAELLEKWKPNTDTKQAILNDKKCCGPNTGPTTSSRNAKTKSAAYSSTASTRMTQRAWKANCLKPSGYIHTKLSQHLT